MSELPPPPRPFPIRKVGDGDWEVLIGPEDMWLACRSEHDARVIREAPMLQHEVLSENREWDAAFADKLEECGRVLAAYRISSGSRFFLRVAEEMRK